LLSDTDAVSNAPVGTAANDDDFESPTSAARRSRAGSEAKGRQKVRLAKSTDTKVKPAKSNPRAKQPTKGKKKRSPKRDADGVSETETVPRSRPAKKQRAAHHSDDEEEEVDPAEYKPRQRHSETWDMRKDIEKSRTAEVNKKPPIQPREFESWDALLEAVAEYGDANFVLMRIRNSKSRMIRNR